MLVAAILLFGGTSNAQVVYPHTLQGCLDASLASYDHCVTIYPESMCDNTYNIHWDLCHLQYAE